MNHVSLGIRLLFQGLLDHYLGIVIGATLTHPSCLRSIEDDDGWISTVMEEAEKKPTENLCGRIEQGWNSGLLPLESTLIGDFEDRDRDRDRRFVSNRRAGGT